MNIQQRLRRISIEAEKLTALHPDVIQQGTAYYCYIYPKTGPARRITVQTTIDYPFVAPTVFVYPFEDLDGLPHILVGGGICYMHADEWNPNLHTLSYVFTQAKRIAYEAVRQRYGI